MNRFQTLIQTLENNIDRLALGELAFPATEIETIVNCLDVNCSCRLQLNSEKLLIMMRCRPLVPATEASALKCYTCHSCHCISQAIDAALERGFQRPSEIVARRNPESRLVPAAGQTTADRRAGLGLLVAAFGIHSTVCQYARLETQRKLLQKWTK